MPHEPNYWISCSENSAVVRYRTKQGWHPKHFCSSQRWQASSSSNSPLIMERFNKVFGEIFLCRMPSWIPIIGGAIRAISNAILQDKLPRMSQFAFSPDILGQLLTCFLADPFHPGFQFLECLVLSRTKFTPSSLSSAFRLGNFPRVKEMDFSFSSLRNCFGALFTDHSCTFPLLEFLNLTNTGLSVVDLNHFRVAVHRTTFVNLRRLFMSHNVLENEIGKILTDSGFPFLEVLEMCNTQLNKVDVISLSVAVHSGKLPRLKVLNLAENVLTDTLSFLLDDFCGTSGFRSLESLSLGNTDLCKTDMEFLSGAIISERLPNLGSLDLEGNSLSLKQDVTENLILFCASQ